MIFPVQFRILNRDITYTGSELRPHWGLEQTKVYGSLLTVFVGACEVATNELVDMEDRLANDFIRAGRMLHVIGEFFGAGLENGVLYQRLFISWAEKLLRDQGVEIWRNGDDLMTPAGKLSVSIATVSPVSVLIHWGINIDAAGAPVKASSLGGLLGWDDAKVLGFAKELASRYIEELHDIQTAVCKVRPVFGETNAKLVPERSRKHPQPETLPSR